MVRGTGDDTGRSWASPTWWDGPPGTRGWKTSSGMPRGRPGRPAWARAGRRGTLRLDVRPGDASIYVDGAFRGAARDLDSLQLSPGRHRIEMVRPGYRTLERDVEVRPGETSELRAELDRS